MKKLFYLFLLPLAVLMSCNDDKISPVDLTVTLSGVSLSDGSFYTVAGENVTIDGVAAKSVDGKASEVANMVFDLSGIPLIGQPGNPFMGTFTTEDLKPGTYSLGLTGNLLQVDASIQVFAVSFPLVIVESADQLPADAQVLGTYSQTVRLENK